MKGMLEKAESVAQIDDADKDYINDAALAVLHEEPKKQRLILFSSLVFFVIVIMWAALTQVDEIVRAQGTAIPSGNVQIVQSLDGGILESLNVTTGQSVKKGQVLLTVDDTDASALFIKTETEFLAALAKAARLEAEVAGTDPVYDARVQEGGAQLIVEENKILEIRRQSMDSELRIALLDKRDSTQELANIQKQNVSLNKQLDLVSQQREINKPLVERGAVPAIELLKIDQRLSELKAKINENKSLKERVETKLMRLDETINKMESEYLSRAQEELARVTAAIKISEAGLASDDARARRSQLESPTTGVIKNIYVTTIGEVVLPGEDIIEIVPIDDEIIFEAKVNPKDIGFVRKDLVASVKVSAYEFATYGGLEARVDQISADTIIDEETRIAYYMVRLKVKNTLEDAAGNPLPILPGMQASIDIKVNKKSVLTYMFKPLLRMVKS